MKEPLDNFLEQMKATLSRHEEAYDEGAWERFAAKNINSGRKPKGLIAPIWKWAAAAAAILVGAVLLIQLLNAPATPGLPGSTGPVTAGTEGKETPSGSTAIIKKDSTTQEQAAAATLQMPSQDSKQLIPTAPSYVIKETFKNKNTQKQHTNKGVTPVPVAPEVPAMAVQQPKPTPQQQPEPEKKQEVPFYQNRVVPQDMAQAPAQRQDDNRNIASATQQSPKSERKTRDSRWASSLYVSPTFGTDNVNMGYGYQLGYEISDKISVSSGIAYAKMSASKNYNAPEVPTMGMAMYGTTYSNDASNMRAAAAYIPSAPTHLQSVDAWVSGIDIPVEVNYNISKKVYASGGVSGLFVLDGKTKETFQDNNVRVTVQNPQDRIKEDKNVALSSPYNNEQPESTPFLGFYNVSMGYKQKISNKNSVSVEPFIKVPMKQVTQQKLNYTGVGVRLKFDF